MTTTLKSTNAQLSPSLRRLTGFTSLINFAVGLVFLFGPETGLTDFLWPSPIPPVLLRFIGSIIVGNGVGAALIARWGDWKSARALFMVAFVYGVIVFFGLLYHLLTGTANPLFWGYLVVDAVFLFPIGYIFWVYEQANRS